MAIVYGVMDTKKGQALGSFWRQEKQAITYKNDQCYLLNCNDDRFQLITIEESELTDSFIIREY